MRAAMLMAAVATGLAASPVAAAEAPRAEEIRIPPELTDPRTIETLSRMTGTLSKALLDLPIGELEAAAHRRPATSADRSRTVRDASRISEREIQQRIAEAGPQVQSAMQAFARALPAMTKALSEAADEIERATANMPQPGYPRR